MAEDGGEPLTCLTQRNQKQKRMTISGELERVKAASVETANRLECELEQH